MFDGADRGWPEWLARLESELVGTASSSWLDRIAHRVVCHAFLKPGESVADLGAGAGLLVKMLASAVGPAGRVYAVDASQECLAGIENECAIMKMDNVLAVTGRLEDLPLDSGTIDAAVCRSALAYSVDRVKSVAEMKRVLKPRGRFSVFEPLMGEMEWRNEKAAGEDFLKAERLLRERRAPLALDRSRARGTFTAGGLDDFESLVVHFDLGLEGRTEDELLREYLFDLPGELSAMEVLKGAGVSEEIALGAAFGFARAAATGALKGRLPGIFIWGTRDS